MILATGSITLYRNGGHAHHSFGYYLAAMRHFDAGFMANGVSAIQDLLLICRFGVYHHTGTFRSSFPSRLSPAFAAFSAQLLTEGTSLLLRNLNLGRGPALRPHVYRAGPPPTTQATAPVVEGTASTQGILGMLHD